MHLVIELCCTVQQSSIDERRCNKPGSNLLRCGIRIDCASVSVWREILLPAVVTSTSLGNGFNCHSELLRFCEMEDMVKEGESGLKSK
jgi:hypothetical protein